MRLREFCGRLEDAVGDLQQAQALYGELGDDQGRAEVLHNLGRIHRKQGKLGDAATCLEQALTARLRGRVVVRALTLRL